MAFFLSRLLKRLERLGEKDEAPSESFAARFHRFKLFLGAYLEAYSEIMTFEERLAEANPIGMPFLRLSLTKLTIASMSCVLQLNSLGGGRFKKLNEPFAALRKEVQGILDQGASPLRGPLIIPFDAIMPEHEGLVSPNLAKLGAVRGLHPEFMPRGFVLSGAAWWEYFNNPEMHDEIDRIMLISQEDPSSYAEAAATIRERLAGSFDLPDSLNQALDETLRDYLPEFSEPDHTLLVRCMPVKAEHGALVMPEQVLRTPVDAEKVRKAVRSSLGMAYRTRAMIYRLKLGIRDRAMPLCVSLTLIPGVHARGSVHRKLDKKHDQELFLHVRRDFSSPDNLPNLASDVSASLQAGVRARIEESASAALQSLADSPVPGNRHELFWAASESGEFLVLGVTSLPDPSEEAAAPGETPEATRDAGEGGGLSGGLCTYPGVVEARLSHVRNFADALAFPIGNILVVQQASPRWAFLLDFASGAVACDGTGNGLFARTARRYGRPTILGQPAAFERLENGQRFRLEAGADRPPLIRRLYGSGEKSAAAENPELARRAADGRGALWLAGSDIAKMTRELAPKVVPLTLPDSDDLEFRAENCVTFRDFLSYCHVRAVNEMFRSGTTRKSAQAPAKQLVCDVPKQFWIINLDDGFYGAVKGPAVRLEEVASLPMRALWEGFSDKPWEGPPQLDAKGFLSVLFEATANPNLDPASQSTTYTEKNVFLIARRFCSMRCRFGFHFLSLDCLLGEGERMSFIVFQFKGGAANLQRRIRRVHFVAELLSQFDFATEISGDTLTARLEDGKDEDFLRCLRVLGYIVMHTRQLDMIMGDEAALASRRFQMLEDMLSLHRRPLSPLQK